MTTIRPVAMLQKTHNKDVESLDPRTRVLTYSLGHDYDILGLYEHGRTLGLPCELYDGVLHVTHPPKEKGQNPYHLFHFPYGCTICWGMPPAEEQEMLETVQPFTRQPYQPVVDSLLTFAYDSGPTRIIEEQDHCIINQETAVMAMLSFSHALSQSIKIIVYEESVQKTIRTCTRLTEELATCGTISLSREALGRMIGSLFMERHRLHAHEDILDVPEFFWRRTRWEPLYRMAASFLEIQTRVQILNRRSSMVYELYSMLSDELKHQHSSRLEWIVIVLIAVEVFHTFLPSGVVVLCGTAAIIYWLGRDWMSHSLIPMISRWFPKPSSKHQDDSLHRNL